MFADACEKAAKFTRPVIISTRQIDGKVASVCGSFIVLNKEGWIITAGHMFDSFVKFQSDQQKIKEIESLNYERRPGYVNKKVIPDSDWITNHSFWWAWDNVKLADAYVDRQLDIAIGRLEPFNPEWVSEYPVLRNPDSLRTGTSLCRLGFPFAQIESEFEEKTNNFRIIKGLPLPLFPNEGIHTRNLLRGKSKEGDYELLYVETSSPGLRGQSGGPIYDTACRLYAMQVQTAHISLGFNPSAEVDGHKIVENQFMNVGLGIHIKTIATLLKERGIHFDIE